MPLNRLPHLTFSSFRLHVLTPLILIFGLGFSMEVTAMVSPSQTTEHQGTHVPIKNIILYSSGVGFFQHEGTIEGPTHIDFRFRTEAINDLLKSLVVQDGSGGSNTTIIYDSHDPLSKTLQGFGIDLTTNPSLGQLLNQLRGESIEIEIPNPLAGKILGVETKTQQLVHGASPTLLKVEYLNIVTETGLRSIPLNDIHNLQFRNSHLNQELHQALAILASGHDSQRKTVSIHFDDSGTHEVSIGYLTESPVWKTSYRLVLQKDQDPFLQGWAIVENTTDFDWNQVHLSLASGRPLSFTMNLYQPLYIPRPHIDLELYQSLRPPLYEDDLAQRPEEALDFSRMERKPFGFSANSGGFAEKALAQAMLSPRSPSFMDRGQELSARAHGVQTGEVFHYVLDAPVTLTRQTSAMLPIINQTVSGNKVSIFNATVHEKHPLNGYRLKNISSNYLMQGPITVYDEQAYAGDARLQDLAPGQDRLISYALDLRTEVSSVVTQDPQEIVAISIRKGTLLATKKLVRQRTYQIRSKNPQPHPVLIEHPVSSHWELTSPVKPLEQTRDVYRFQIDLPSSGEANLEVHETSQTQQTIQLTTIRTNLLAFYLKAPKITQQAKEALQHLADLRNQLDRVTQQRSQLENRQDKIVAEQKRIRDNMSRLSNNSNLFHRYTRKLNDQETELEGLQQETQTLIQQETQQKQAITDYLLNLDIQ